MANTANSISLKKIGLTRGGRELVSDLSLVIHEGERVGLIGRNGCGKSTLMRTLLNPNDPYRIAPDEGEVIHSSGLRLGYLPQNSADDTANSTASVEDYLFARCGSAVEAASIYRALNRCGFADNSQAVASLSGGWLKRLSFAELLASDPGFLLLDEPTNHLDVSGLIWLERLLGRLDGGYVMVSHDRHFLDSVCDRIIELSPALPEGYLSVQGNFTRFREVRQERLVALQAERQRLSSITRRENEWLQAGVKARTTKASARIQNAHKMNAALAELNKKSRLERQTEVGFTVEGHQSKDVLSFSGVGLTRGEKELFSGLKFSLVPGSVLGIVGSNGSGKSSLLQLITEELAPSEGKIKRSPTLQIAYLDQHKLALNPDDTLKEALCPYGDSVIVDGNPLHVISWAERFLFSPSQLSSKISGLSGGEKARVLVARIMTQNATLLILDEPTNDLDIWMLEELEEALASFTGAIVVVSHDRRFLETLCDSYVALSGNPSDSLVSYFASYEQWLSAKEAGEKQAVPDKSSKPSIEAPAKNRPSKGPSYKQKKDLAECEEAISKCESSIQSLEESLQSSSVVSNPSELLRISTELEAANERLLALMDSWESLAGAVI
jgi:ABC transport system ATP-binding/permease protein